MENLVDQCFSLLFREPGELDATRLTDQFQLGPVPFDQTVQPLQAPDQLLECRPSARWRQLIQATQNLFVIDLDGWHVSPPC
jgi:hypothetical protein